MSDLTVIMPSFNEEASLKIILPEWIDECKNNDWQLIIVNDGSTDSTRDVLSGYSGIAFLKVFTHKINKGYGAALKTGIINTQTPFLVTVDSDGQHTTEAIHALFHQIKMDDSDLIIGSRSSKNSLSFRSIGKLLIRLLSRFLLPNNISDLNSGLKMYQSDLAKRFIKACPNTMAFSDIITLTFIAERCKVTEYPVTIQSRVGGKSKITLNSAIDTVIEIVNIVVFFNPLRFFLPLALIFFILGVAWGLPIIIQGKGVSVGSLLSITLASIFFLLGLIAEQISQIRKILIYE